MKKIFLALSLFVIVFTSCKKDKTPDVIVYAEENPLPGFLAATGFGQITTAYSNISYYEQGFTFKPTVKGKINAIVLNIPGSNSALRVTIWKTSTKTPIRIENINYHIAYREISFPIAELVLQMDTTYTISFNSNHFFERYKSNSGAAVFPVKSDNITIENRNTNSAANPTPQPTFPNAITDYRFYYGDLSFKFQRTE